MKRTANLIFMLFFLALLFGVPALTLLIPRANTSFYEQRPLAPLPTVTWDGLKSGAVCSDFEKALSDHLAGRNTMMKWNTRFALFLGRPVVNDIVVSGDVLLSFYGYNYWDTSYLVDQANEVAAQWQKLNEQVLGYGGYFCYVGLPLQSTYFAEKYPDYMDSRLWHTDAIRSAFKEALQQRQIPFYDVHQTYEALGLPERYYAKTDHHYTYEGAFVAYTTLMEKLNTDSPFDLSVLSKEDLEFSSLPNPYLGSSNRKLYGLWGDSREQLEFGTIKNPVPFTRMDNGTLTDAYLYTMPATVEEIVTYDLYMGGDFGETVIQTNRPELPSLLIFGDSFTNPLETLLWASFDETRSLDLRYYTQTSLLAYIEEFKPDVVVCVRDETVYLVTDGNGNVTE